MSRDARGAESVQRARLAGPVRMGEAQAAAGGVSLDGGARVLCFERDGGAEVRELVWRPDAGAFADHDLTERLSGCEIGVYPERRFTEAQARLFDQGVGRGGRDELTQHFGDALAGRFDEARRWLMNAVESALRSGGKGAGDALFDEMVDSVVPQEKKRIAGVFLWIAPRRREVDRAFRLYDYRLKHGRYSEKEAHAAVGAEFWKLLRLLEKAAPNRPRRAYDEILAAPVAERLHEALDVASRGLVAIDESGRLRPATGSGAAQAARAEPDMALSPRRGEPRPQALRPKDVRAQEPRPGARRGDEERPTERRPMEMRPSDRRGEPRDGWDEDAPARGAERPRRPAAAAEIDVSALDGGGGRRGEARGIEAARLAPEPSAPERARGRRREADAPPSVELDAPRGRGRAERVEPITERGSARRARRAEIEPDLERAPAADAREPVARSRGKKGRPEPLRARDGGRGRRVIDDFELSEDARAEAFDGRGGGRRAAKPLIALAVALVAGGAVYAGVFGWSALTGPGEAPRVADDPEAAGDAAFIDADRAGAGDAAGASERVAVSAPSAAAAPETGAPPQGAAIARAQLRALGYELRDQPGAWDGAMQDALRSFQGEAELPVTGMPDEATLRALAAARRDRRAASVATETAPDETAPAETAASESAASATAAAESGATAAETPEAGDAAERTAAAGADVGWAPQRPGAAPPQTPSAAAPDRPAVVVASAPRDQLREIQTELARRGFYGGALDGLWGARTEAAIAGFMRRDGRFAQEPRSVDPAKLLGWLRADGESAAAPASSAAAEPAATGPANAPPATAPASAPAATESAAPRRTTPQTTLGSASALPQSAQPVLGGALPQTSRPTLGGESAAPARAAAAPAAAAQPAPEPAAEPAESASGAPSDAPRTRQEFEELWLDRFLQGGARQ